MNGKVRGILLILLTLIVIGAIGFALYTLRGLDGLPLIGGKTEKPVVIETPVPTEEPTPEPEEASTPEPVVVAEESPEPAAPAAQPENDALSSLTGALRTSAGNLRFKSEILGSSQDGEENDSVTLGHVYTNMGKMRVQFLNADGSAFQEPFELDYAAENLYQEPRALDLNGDGNDDLLLRLYTYENEHAILLFAFDPDASAYVRVGILQNDVLTWSSDFDAASNLIWYRHGTTTLQYDCYELQGTELVMLRRLEDSRKNSEEERFTEYMVDGSRMLILQEKVPASAIDHAKWNFVNFN